MACILWQTIIPFNPQPEEPQPIPRQIGEINDAQMKLCQAIFDQAEDRRSGLEQKAQWTFAIIVFLAPLLMSLYIFLFRDASTDTAWHVAAICFLFTSCILLLLGFVSAVRAISVKTRYELFIQALVDSETGKFRPYNKSFHARGLLYCAAMNTAMNDHIAQFVKGAHILVAGAVIALLVAAVPASFEFSNHTSSPTQTNIVGSVNVTSVQLDALRDQLRGLDDAIFKSGARSQLELLQDRVIKLETERTGIKKVAPTGHHRSSPTSKANSVLNGRRYTYTPKSPSKQWEARP